MREIVVSIEAKTCQFSVRRSGTKARSPLPYDKPTRRIAEWRKTREERLEEIGNSSCMSFHVIYLNRKEKGQIASLRCVRKKKEAKSIPL